METTLSDTRPTFSRLTEGKARQSWRAAVPVVLVLIAFVALVAYLASSLSSYSQKASLAERDSQQYRDQLTAMSKQVDNLQKEVALDRSPGRTTVVLQAPEPAGKKRAAAPQQAQAWAAVTWGEQPDGKTWMRANGYGMGQGLDGGKSYHLWMQPQSGDPIDLGVLDVDPNGSGFAMKSDLPGIDQGKSVMLTTDLPDSKQPGDVVAQADLPKLQPAVKPAPKAPADNNQARPGNDAQQMHQSR
ncbi:MAG TPA: anti-sigma factor [Myxococcales bacterium]|nr:anti-sigma factor [Myxococcales bacterium]